MSLASVVKVELVKLSRKKTTRLLLLLFAPSVLFGVGMSLGLSFFVSDGAGGGVDAVGGAMAGLGFAVSMMEQSDFILFLVAIILASLSLSGELENGQIKSEIIRVCGRWKIVLAKYIALLSCIIHHHMLTAKAGKVFCDNAVDLPGLHIVHHAFEVRTLEIGSAPSVIDVFIDHMEIVVACELSEDRSLRFNGNAVAVFLVITAESHVKCGIVWLLQIASLLRVKQPTLTILPDEIIL